MPEEEGRLKNSLGCNLVARTYRNPSGTMEGNLAWQMQGSTLRYKLRKSMRMVEAEQRQGSLWPSNKVGKAGEQN